MKNTSVTIKALWLAYTLMALVTLLIWTVKDWFPVTGDESHYLVMADGLVQDQTFEQTNAYKREFKTKTICSGGLASAESIPSPKNTHAIVGPHGLYNIHNIGLPILISLPYVLTGIIGVKIYLVLLSSLIIIISYKTASLFSESNFTKAVSVIAASFSPNIIVASNQIFPDFMAGLISLYAGYRILYLTKCPDYSFKHNVLLMILIAYLPWLQIKFAGTACVLTAGLLLIAHKREADLFPRIFSLVLPLVISLILLVSYNQHAFGKPTGPYGDGALEISHLSLIVFVGLHLDRLHGIFIQNPIFFAGLLFLFPFLRKNKIAGGTLLLTYASLIIPNALHPGWYGGYSFAGRFALSGALTILPIIIYSVIKILRNSKVGLYLVFIGIIFNFITYSLLTFQKYDLYNKTIPSLPLSSYPSYHPQLSNFLDFLPALFDRFSAYGFNINWIFIVFFLGLMLTGLFYSCENTKYFFRSVKLFCLISLVHLLISGFTSLDRNESRAHYYNGKPMIWNASELPSNVGVIDRTKRVAKGYHGNGFLTSGPYVRLSSGAYKFEIKLNAVSETIEVIGYVDIYMIETGERLNQIAIWSNGTESITGIFRISEKASGNKVEIRTSYHGIGEISVETLEITPLKQYP